MCVKNNYVSLSIFVLLITIKLRINFQNIYNTKYGYDKAQFKIVLLISFNEILHCLIL